ncbi:hypothetical protein OBCHQ24_15480 [Oceanobacillus iheyensis]|nr:hypothetical protein OBCHQ24_15480 [Oceanobacillus iheyensis]
MNNMSKRIIRDKIKNNDLVYYSYNFLKLFYFKYILTDKALIKKRFRKRLGREVNLIHPIKFNDKLQWLKLNWRDPLATKCADKFEVREYVEKMIGSDYLNELYGVYESIDEINIDKLPKSFVLKGTHGSGFNIICKDKNKMDWKLEFKKMKRWLKTNYYWRNREWVYRDIKPRIICERYMEEKESGELRDYKIFCFNGEPKIIEVDFDRFDNHKRNFYDLKWHLIDLEIQYPSDGNVNIKQPKTLEKMIELSKILSKNFPHVRVDFYNLDDQIIFGELTFFHESGMGKFYPPEFELEMGNYINLPN